MSERTSSRLSPIEASAAGFGAFLARTYELVPADQESNTIVAVLQKGYLISDRVLRPALVTVAAPK